MPERPTWEQVTGFAEELNGIEDGVSGIAMRGLPGWGANMAAFDTFVNTYGGRWYNLNWEPQVTTPEFRNAIEAYANLAEFAQPGVTSTTSECLTLFSSGKAAMWTTPP